MKKSKQLIEGDKTEEQVSSFFRENGYASYITQKKMCGQPVDLFAFKENDFWILDAKHVRKEDASFKFDRVEPNQQISMEYYQNFANIKKNMGFAIVFDREPNTIYFLSFEEYVNLKQNGSKSVNMKDLKSLLKYMKGE